MTKLRAFLSAAALAVTTLFLGGAPSYAIGVPAKAELGGSAVPGAAGGLVQKAHYFHCRRVRGHRHWRACRKWRRSWRRGHHRLRRHHWKKRDWHRRRGHHRRWRR